MIEAEGEWLANLPEPEKIRFLANLSCYITVAGRNSYEAGTDALANPRQLRRVNEIHHRVAACLRQAINGENSPEFERSIAVWVLANADAELSDLLHWFWTEAKTRT